MIINGLLLYYGVHFSVSQHTMGRGPLHRYIKLKLIAPGEDILEIKSRSEDTAIQKGTVNDKGEILVGNKKFNSIGKFVQLVYCTKTSKKVFYKDQSLHEIKNVLSNGSLIQRDIASTPPPFYHDFVEQIQECINLRFNFDLRGMCTLRKCNVSIVCRNDGQ